MEYFAVIAAVSLLCFVAMRDSYWRGYERGKIAGHLEADAANKWERQQRAAHGWDRGKHWPPAPWP